MKGKIKSYSRSHGYGFIQMNDKEIFFHMTVCQVKPKIGKEVEFKAVETSKGLRATEVR